MSASTTSPAQASPAGSVSPGVAPPHPPRPARRWPTALSALEVPAYRRFLGAQFVGSTGLWVQRIAQDWLILEITGSAAAVGLVVMLQFAPMLLLGLYGGVLADRFPKRKLLMVGQATAAALSALLGVLALTGTVQAWHVYAIAVCLGLVTVIDQPSRQAFVSELVGPKHLRNAVSLNSSVFQFSGLLGPALSGVLIHAVGQGLSFLINALACVIVTFVLSTARASHAVPPRPRMKGQLVDGLRYIRRTPTVAWAIGLVALAGLFGFNMPVILAAFADQDFHAGVQGYSLFTSLQAVGALLGALAAARRTERTRMRTLTIALGGVGVFSLLLSVVHNYVLFCAILIAHGFCALTFLIGANSLVQLTTAPEVRGRVMSVYTMMLFGGQAIASPLLGRFTDALGPRVAILTCGVAIAVLVTVLAALIGRQSHLGLRVRRQRGHAPRLRIIHT